MCGSHRVGSRLSCRLGGGRAAAPLALPRTHRAKLSGLKGEWSRGFTFTATVTVPRGWTLETWTISHNGREQYFSSQTG